MNNITDKMINNNTLIIEFGEKFTSGSFDEYVERYFNRCFDYQNVIFQLENIEWISLEEIVFLFGWIRYIKKHHPNLKKLKINLPKLSPYSNNIQEKRRHKRLLNLWNVWKIWKCCDLDLSEETNVDSSINKYVDAYLQRDANWHTIIPFTCLDSSDITSFNSIRDNIESRVNAKFNLTEEVEQLLEKYSSLSSFENKALSGIITTELFLNSAIHAYTVEEKEQFAESYFAVSLRNKIDIQAYKENKIKKGYYSQDVSNEKIKKDIDNILRWNLDEKSKEEKKYFEDLTNKNIATNDSFIEFTFLDFGAGIPNKLRKRYREANIKQLPLSAKHQAGNNGNYSICEDSRILEYAFLLDTSSNPFNTRLEINNFVPRGLFFLVDIIRRYKGLLIVRSGNGKIVYNFQNTSVISESVEFSDQDSNFPDFHGTLISIYLPKKTEEEISRNTVEISFENKFKSKSNITGIEEYININEIIKINCNTDYFNSSDLTQIYENIFLGLNKKIDSFKYKNCTIYIDFSGSENINIINRKLYFFLGSTPRFDKDTNLIIVYPPNIGELYQTKEAIKQSQLQIIYKPVPCLLSHNKEAVQIVWLGISNEDDEYWLNAMMLKNKSAHISKFLNKHEIGGNVIRLTEEEFVTINVKNISNILKIYSPEYIYNEIPELFIRNCMKDPMYNILYNSDIYWASGGYYQDKFIALLDALYRSESDRKGKRGETMDARFGERVARYLIEKYNYQNDKPLDIDCIVTVTLSSQLLGKHIKNIYSQIIGSKKEPELIRLAHYHEFTLEQAFKHIKEYQNVLIVNDVISTGNLSVELEKKLREEKKANIVAIFTLFDSRDSNWNLRDSKIPHFYFPKDKDGKEILLYKLIDEPIIKYKYRKSINDYQDKKVISIDPVINSPSMMNLDRSMGANLEYFEKKENKKNEDFLNIYTKNENLWIGHFHHNMHHHLYYFKTNDILCSETGSTLLEEIFTSIWNSIEERDYKAKEINYVFYPMFSAIEELATDRLKDILPNNSNVQTFPLPRIDTPKGWRFSFPPKSLNAEGWNYEKRNVVIIDDGCSTGDTILQMIDSIAMIEVNRIILISVIARLEDFQREFYSRISSVKGFKQFESYTISKDDTWNSIAVRFFNKSEEKIIGKTIKDFEKRIEKHNRPLNEVKTIGIPIKKWIEDIPLSVYFGAHFHIPVYSPLRHCPFCKELTKLDEEHNQSAPDSVKEYINKRKNEIALHETNGTTIPPTQEVYKGMPSYFPIHKDFDAKKTFLARDIIGKIDTYRLYRDYIKDSDNSSTSYDGIDIDYYLAVILHEERLISSIGHLLPQLKSLLIKVVKNEIGIETNDPSKRLKYNWQKTQIIKALFLLNEKSLFDLSNINTLINFVDIDATNYFIYLFWIKLCDNKIENNTLNNHISLLNEIIKIENSDRKIKTTWGQFRSWVQEFVQKKRFAEHCGYSFSWMKDFYIRKHIEYPNHDTIGNIFLNDLCASVKATTFRLNNQIDINTTERYNDAKKKFEDAQVKIKPFLDIRKDENFKKGLSLCGVNNNFLDGNKHDICFILEKIKVCLENEDVFISSLDEIDKLSESIYKEYFSPKSDFAQFFDNHQFNISSEFSKISENREQELYNKIRYQNNVRTNAKVNIHLDCFKIIINELYTNALKHFNTSIFFDIYEDSDCVIISCKCQLMDENFEYNSDGNGFKTIKAILDCFNGKYKRIEEEDFHILISIPIVKEK